MDKHYGQVPTSIRLDEKTASEVKYLSEQARISQSDVLRQLISIALKDKSKFVLAQQAVLSDEAKTMLLDIAARLTEINTAINKVGSLINLRRRSYNTDRKIITDKIQAINHQIKNATSSYDKIKLNDSLKNLQDELNEFDANVPTLVEADDWTKFEKIKDNYMQISSYIGKELDKIW